MNAVMLHRRRLGIPNPHNEFVPWTAEEKAMLGKIPDEEIARRTGRPIGSVSNKRQQQRLPKPNAQRKYWSEEEIRLLGTAPDKEIAQRLGRSAGRVKGQRFTLKIRKFSR